MSALTTFVAKGDATRFLAEAETDLVPGESLNVANGKQSFASYDDEWLDTRTDLRPKTIYLYRCLFETFLELILGRKEIGRLDARAIRRFDYDPDGRRTGVITPEGLVRPHHRSCLRSS